MEDKIRFYKIRNKETGKFSSGGTNYEWTTGEGRVFNRQSDLIKHLAWAEKEFQRTNDLRLKTYLNQAEIITYITYIEEVTNFILGESKDERDKNNPS